MKVNISRIDTSLPLPEYASTGACAFDMYSRETITIQPNEIALLPTNFIIQVPENYVLTLAPRSSLARKKGLIMPNSIGIIDQDYSGEKDEIMIQVQNITQEPTTVERGERVAQGLLLQIGKAEWTEVTPNKESRGGFGSTGGYE